MRIPTSGLKSHRKHRDCLAALLWLAALMNACGPLPVPVTGKLPLNPTRDPGRILQETFHWEGEEVGYELRVPQSYRHGWTSSLIISLQERGATAADQEAITHMAENPQGKNFFILYPQPALPSANTPDSPAWSNADHAAAPEDLRFLAALVDHLAFRWDIDPARLYLVGLGSGASFAHAIACRSELSFRAVSLVGGHYPEGTECAPAAPTSLFLMNSTDEAGATGEGRPGEQPVEDLYRRWAALNDCISPPGSPYRRGDVEVLSQSGCAGGAEVLLFTLAGSNHAWPARPDLNTTDLVWKFFLSHP